MLNQEEMRALLQKAKDDYKQNHKFFERLKKRLPTHIDTTMQNLHDEVFEEKIDCLQCANCCKTTSPIFMPKDIERIAKHLKMPIQKFIDTYLRIDEDQDYVLKQSPCFFLGEDNYCSIYEVRPRACQTYPHTDRKNAKGIFDLTLKNTKVCPAVAIIVDKMQNLYEGKKKGE